MFTVGEFAALARVSRRLLRYYDEIGLLKPAQTDRFTGYRYYTAEQMAHLNRILVLKELGLSLDQIQRMLNDQITTDELQGMLLLKKAEIEQQLTVELQRVRKIEARLNAIRSNEAHKPLDVVIKDVSAHHALSVTTLLESFEAAVMLHQRIRAALPEQSGYGLSFIICHDGEIVEKDMTLELGCLTESADHAPVMLDGGLRLAQRQLPAATMATTIVTGGIEAIHAGYGEIALWIEANGYRLAGAAREITLQAATSFDGRDYITEIQYPVETARRRPELT